MPAIADARWRACGRRGTHRSRKEEGFTYGVLVGHQFLPYLAVEAAYVDLGDAEFKSNATVSDSSNTTEFLWGVGIGYTRGNYTGRLDYQQYTDVGDSSTGEASIDRLTFVAIVRF